VPPLVSVVIPAYNPEPFLIETIASAEAQTHSNCEVIVVDDGSDKPESLELLSQLERQGVPVVRQENKGLAGARNTGIRHAKGDYVVPLDADDLLEPQMVERCVEELQANPDAGFVYFDYTVFGDSNYIERPGEYNFYRLLSENFMACCCCMPKVAWEQIGGYDEWHHWGYEDWSFFINLGKNGYFGRYVEEPLFRYRTHGRGLHYIGLDRHESNWAHMEQTHPEALSPEGRLRIKREWSPSICVVQGQGSGLDLSRQTLQDYQLLSNVGEAEALARSQATAFLWLTGDAALKPQTLEECVWGLQDAQWVSWRDTGAAPPPSLERCAGPLGVSREAMEWPEPKKSGEVRRLNWKCRAGRGGGPAAITVTTSPQVEKPVTPAPASRLRRHLENAELLSTDAWIKHPVRSALRLVPLRAKERVNELAGRPVFDLSFYLKFQPRSVLIDGNLIEQLDYLTLPKGTRKRIGFFTPNLGVGGAELVLREIVGQVDRSKVEIVLAATHSKDSRMLPEWREIADWVYDIGKLVPQEGAAKFLYSLALNWELDALIVQNAPLAYAVLPALKEKRSQLKTADVLHAVDENWDLFAASLEVAEQLDRRVVISDAGKNRLLEMEIPEEKIAHIPNGVDLERFSPRGDRGVAFRQAFRIRPDQSVIGFVGRLDEIKRPLLLPSVARELNRVAPECDYVFVIAGSGPEEAALRSKIDGRLSDRFRLIGATDRPEEVLAAADVLIIPSAGEGVPLVLLEALATGTPVVASRAGAIEEALDESTGILVEPGQYEEVRLAEALAELVGDEPRRAAMSTAARAKAERNHDLEKARHSYRTLVQDLTSPHFSPPDGESTQ